MNILIMGAPGAGKGTMSEKIVDEYGIVHISTGDILRAAVKEESELGLKAKEYMDRGQLVPDQLVDNIILNRLNQDDMTEGFLMDGYPRTISQAESFEKILSKVGKHIDCVINLVIDEEMLADRITGRRVCPKCKAIYHINTKKPTKVGICDECGDGLIQRKDDTLESLKIRLEAYHKQTQPIIEHYKKQGLIIDVDANNSASEVFKNIAKALESVK
ncbi:MAG: adenylate kinase [Erysipelotrichaceae bacterium]|nr:adenylate kinase [Erysipelotrichaceae bacterium]